MLSWGSNSYGQLGLGREIPSQKQPALVAGLTGVAVSQISAGATHTMMLTLPGLVYCCGANESGQLGLNRVDEKGTDSRPFSSSPLPQCQPPSLMWLYYKMFSLSLTLFTLSVILVFYPADSQQEGSSL